MARHFDPFRQAPSGWIFHCDADAFYAACHMAEDATVRQRPLAVAGDPKNRHGIIVTANYVARRLGIRTGMNVGAARELCPQLVVIEPDKSLYRRYSQGLHNIFSQYTHQIEPLSLDEAWLDMSGVMTLKDDPVPVAKGLQTQVGAAVGISVSVGISVNKMLAKQVSDWNKPEGITVLRYNEIADRLWPRPVFELFGCGPATAEKMARLGIETIGDLAHQRVGNITHHFGQHGLALRLRAAGDDYTPVTIPRPEDRRSVSAEHTTAYDIVRGEDVLRLIGQCAGEVSDHLESLGLVGYKLAIKWRTRDFATHTRQTASYGALQSRNGIFRLASRLWRESGEKRPIRLAGVSVSRLGPPSQQLHFWNEGIDPSLGP